MPSSPSFAGGCGSNPLSFRCVSGESLCREYGVPFLDPDYPDFYGHREFFKDEAHLNDSGARRYSAQLAEEILSEP